MLNKYKLYIICFYGFFESIKLYIWDFIVLEIYDLFQIYKDLNIDVYKLCK